jgi:predicted component of type VI protein secretion system
MVSRKHCEINLDHEQVMIRDFGSRNGTFLNGQRIEEASAKAGDLLQIGPVQFVIQVDGQPAAFDSYTPEMEDQAEKADIHDDLDVSKSSHASHSETTEILNGVPDDFDIETSLEDEFSKEK